MNKIYLIEYELGDNIFKYVASKENYDKIKLYCEKYNKNITCSELDEKTYEDFKSNFDKDIIDFLSDHNRLLAIKQLYEKDKQKLEKERKKLDDEIEKFQDKRLKFIKKRDKPAPRGDLSNEDDESSEEDKPKKVTKKKK